MNRKKFLKKIGLGILTGVGISSFYNAANPVDQDVEDCRLTAKDIIGPFFVAGTANVLNLNTYNLPGTPMRVAGYVYSGEGDKRPLTNAKIEIWHADDDGAYHPEGSGDVSAYKDTEITLRGHVMTDTNGFYMFESIRPGLYGKRARHIHYKVTVNGHETLVTQGYFADDERLLKDAFSRTAGDCRIVDFQKDEKGRLAGIMNFNLKKLDS